MPYVCLCVCVCSPHLQILDVLRRYTIDDIINNVDGVISIQLYVSSCLCVTQHVAST